ncbi:MAG: VWA containing CoxE family protein [Magnetovibrio sp.]|nr:VWA containing CoxE family protein [Magnetovibrio sp.]
MQRLLESFIRTLRAAEIPVSMAEAIDAHQVLDRIGYADRELVKNALGITLAKTVNEKKRFSESFDVFFSRLQFTKNMENGSQTIENAQSISTGSDLADKVLAHDRTGLIVLMEVAARQAGIEDIQFVTQVSLFTRRLLDLMGLAEMEGVISSANRELLAGGKALAATLEIERIRLYATARDYVERQFFLHSRYSSEQLRNKFLQNRPFAAIDRRDFDLMNRIIRRMARRLSSRYSYKQKLVQRGNLDVNRTIRKNMAYNGVIFETVWKKKKIDKPKFLAVCDVSRSVAAAANFFLLFLYNLNGIVSDMRSFAFSSYLLEISRELKVNSAVEFIPNVLEKIGFMSTDYGQALSDLKEQFGQLIDRRTTVFILGDARSNNSDPRLDIMRWINQRASRVVWLNPEPQTFWGTGDSEMLRYRPYCDVSMPCRTIKQLERVIDETLRSTKRP